MATPNPQQTPLPPEQRLALEQKARYERITRNLAIGGLVACPIIALLPPRKLDLYTFTLGVGFYLSADHLYTLRTGRGIVSQFNPMRTVDLPTDKAREFQRQFAEAKEREMNASGGEASKTALEKLWMGDEKEGWRERRLEEEKKALQEGKTFSDMIFGQIWDVWNWDKKKNKGGDGSGSGDEGSKK